MKAAEELILAKGYANTTIDEIAARADVSKGAVYLHFGTKADIYFSIVAKALEVMRDMFREAMASEETGLEKFGAIGYAFYEYTRRYPEYSSTLYDANAPSPSSGSASAMKCYSLNEEVNALMVSSIEKGVADGSIRSDVDPKASALVISHSLRGLLRAMLAEGETLKRRGLDEEYIVDYAMSLYGRSLMVPSGTCSTMFARNKRSGQKKRRK